MTVEIVGTDVASGARITLTTVAYHIVRSWIQCAIVGMRMVGCDGVWATAWPTSDFTAQQWVSVESFDTAIAIRSRGEVLTIDTFASVWIAVLAVSVTFAHLTIREIPESWLTLVTFTAVSVGMTGTLAC